MRRIFGKARKPDLRGIRAFESRTQVWQAAGLGTEIDRGDARRARREAFVLLLLIAGVIVVFAMRKDLFPDAGKEVRYITAGVLAGSIALLSFGLDSAIEGVASLVIVWRFTGGRLLSHAAEERAQKLVAIQFFLLAPYVAFEALHTLVTVEQPETSWLGIALVTSSLIAMPILGIAKRRLADQLGSVATRGEGTQNLLCAYLAAAVLVGLLGNALFGLWWLDPAAALVVAAVAVKEGRASWRGEGCCANC